MDAIQLLYHVFGYSEEWHSTIARELPTQYICWRYIYYWYVANFAYSHKRPLEAKIFFYLPNLTVGLNPIVQWENQNQIITTIHFWVKNEKEKHLYINEQCVNRYYCFDLFDLSNANQVHLNILRSVYQPFKHLDVDTFSIF